MGPGLQGIVSELRENQAGNDLLQSFVAGQRTYLSVSILRQDSHLGHEGIFWGSSRDHGWATESKLVPVGSCSFFCDLLPPGSQLGHQGHL